MNDLGLVHDLRERQAGVISRRQALDAGLTPNDLRRLLRRNEAARVHDGVFVDHTGPLTWLQRAWAAVLFSEPAALCGEAARRAADGPGRTTYDDGKPIDVAVSRHRNLVEPVGVRLHRVSDLGQRVLWNASPRESASSTPHSGLRPVRPETSTPSPIWPTRSSRGRPRRCG